MRILHVDPKLLNPSAIEAARINLWMAIEAMLVIGVAALIASVFPPPLVMIMLSILLLISGFGIAFISQLKSEPQEVAAVTHWDLAGGLVFLGFAVALLCEPMDFLTYMPELKQIRPSGDNL